MNALFVANFPSNTGYAWDTIETVFAGVAERLHGAGWTVHISYTSLSSGQPHRMSAKPVVVLACDYPASERSPAALFRLLLLLRGKRIRLLYLTDQPTRDWRYVLYRLAGVRTIVVHDRTSGTRAPRASWALTLKRALHRVPWLSADRVIAVSDFVAERLVRVNGTRSTCTFRVHNGIDLAAFADPDASYMRRVLGLDDRPVIFFAGRANEYKGVHVLIDAVHRLQRDGRDVALVCCGDGPDLDSFLDHSRRLQLNHVLFTGKRDDVRKLLPGASVAVVPSLWAEAFGLAVVEAMAAGVPVVASRTGGIPELIRHGETGLLIEPGDPYALAAAIASVLDDVQLQQRMARQGRAFAATHFGIQRTVREIVGVLCPELGGVSDHAPQLRRTAHA